MQYTVNLTMYNQETVVTDITLTQGDYGQEIVITGLSDARTARLVFRLANGDTVERVNGITKDASGNYHYTLQPTELGYAGTVITDVKFSDANGRESSQKFTFTVTADTITPSLIQGSPYSDSIQAALVQINAIKAQCIAALDNIAHEVGINDEEAELTSAYSGTKTQALIDNTHSLIDDMKSFTVNSFDTGYTKSVVCLKSVKTQYVNGIVEHPIVGDAGSYLTIGWVPETPLYSWFFVGQYISGTNVYPVLFKLSADKTVQIFISTQIKSVTTGASYFNFAYPIA